MLANTLTWNIGGSGGAAVTLTRVREQDFSSLYTGVIAGSPEIRVSMLIRHVDETVPKGQPKTKRHIITTRLEWGDGSDLSPIKFREYTQIIRQAVDDVSAFVVDVPEGTNFLLGASSSALLTAIVGGDS